MTKQVPYRLQYVTSNRYHKFYSQDRTRFGLYHSHCALERRTLISSRSADSGSLERYGIESRCYGTRLEVRELAPVELRTEDYKGLP